jgi:hypothetical protein
MNETSAAEECETSIALAKVASMRHTRNEFTMMHEKFVLQKTKLQNQSIWFCCETIWF